MKPGSHHFHTVPRGRISPACDGFIDLLVTCGRPSLLQLCSRHLYQLAQNAKLERKLMAATLGEVLLKRGTVNNRETGSQNIRTPVS